MIAERQLTVETALALLGPHFLIINVVIPWVAQWVPALALNETETVAMPSFSSLRVYLIGMTLQIPACGYIWGFSGSVSVFGAISAGKRFGTGARNSLRIRRVQPSVFCRTGRRPDRRICERPDR